MIKKYKPLLSVPLLDKTGEQNMYEIFEGHNLWCYNYSWLTYNGKSWAGAR